MVDGVTDVVDVLDVVVGVVNVLVHPLHWLHHHRLCQLIMKVILFKWVVILINVTICLNVSAID